MKKKCILLFIVLFIATSLYAETRIQTLRPDGAGDLTQLTPFGEANNWECVDEATSDENTTYVWMENSWPTFIKDLYTLDDHVGSGTINSVTVYTVSRETISGGRATQRTIIKSGTTTDEGGAAALITSWRTRTDIYTLNPDTGNPWTWAEVDALQAGVGLRGETGYGSKSRCTQVYVEVNWTANKVWID